MKLRPIYGLCVLVSCLVWISAGYAQDLPDDDNLPLIDDLSFLEDIPTEETFTPPEDSETFSPLRTTVNLTFSGSGQFLNDDSRLNPENTIQNIEEGEGAFETNLSVSDYVNAQDTLRWYFQAYGYYSSETNGQNERVNVTRIDEVFTDWKGRNFFFSVGKRRINWGHALAFNPVNVIVPPRDPMNPNQESEGQPAAWLGYSRDAGSLNLYYTRDFDKDWNSDLNRWGARLDMFVGAFDVSLYYFDGQSYQDDRAYERLFGTSFSTNLLAGVTLYSEIAGFGHNYRNYYDSLGTAGLKDDVYIQGVIGSFVMLDPESFLSFFSGDAGLTLEAYYNDGGYSKSERENYFDALDQSLATGKFSVLSDYQMLGMNQFYGLFSYRNSFKERYSAELTGLMAQDASFSLQSQVTYNLSDYYSITAKYIHNQGGGSTEFGNAPVSNLFEVMLDINF